MFILATLIFLSVTLAVGALLLWLMPNKTQQRVRALAEPADKPEWVESMATVMGPFAKLSTPTGDWENSPLRLKFLHAGIRRADMYLLYFAAKTLLPAVFALLAFLSLRSHASADGTLLIFYLFVAALVGCYLPNLLLHWRASVRQREILENFPDAADLMLICVEAGLGLDAGLAKVADEMRMKSRALAEELHLTNLEIRAGAVREKALRNLALRTGVEEIRTFSTMLCQADKFGTSIGNSLRVYSDELRHKRQIRAEELAAKVPTKMLFPLVAFIFPSIIMVILGPALIQIVRTVMPMLTGAGAGG